MVGPILVLRHVAVVRHGRVVVSQHAARERLDFGERSGFPAKGVPSDGCSFNSGTDAEKPHATSP
jgi:hypothetical protein